MKRPNQRCPAGSTAMLWTPASSPGKEPTIVGDAGARLPLREPQLAAQLVQSLDVSGVGHEATGQAGAAIVVPDRVGAREGFVGRTACTVTAADCSQGCMHATK